MKVTRYSSSTPAGGARRTGGTGSVAGASSFAEVLANAETEATHSVSGIGDVAAASLTGMLALQEVSEEELKRNRMVQKGKNLLDELEKLRQQLLIGTLPLQLLHNLERKLAIEKQSVSDPRLMELIDEIELLAAVELAKLERALHTGSFE